MDKKPTTDLSIPEKAVKDMNSRELVSSTYIKEQVSKALPAFCTAERFIRVTQTAFTKNPALWDCSPQSIASVILQSAQFGVEPDGRHAHIIPYKGEATLQLDYKGLVALVRRSGDVVKLHADVVCENDIFTEDLGVIKSHIPNRKEPRGEVYAVYAMAELKDGSQQAVVMSWDEVDAIRKRSRSGDKGPWVTDWNEMAKKTAFRRLTKWLPLSYEAAEAVDHDQRREFGSLQDANIVSPTQKLNATLKAVAKKKPEPMVVDGDFSDAEQPEAKHENDGDL